MTNWGVIGLENFLESLWNEFEMSSNLIKIMT